MIGEGEHWQPDASERSFVHKFTGAIYRLISYRRTINLGENYDGSYSTLPAQMRLENEDGIIETSPHNPNFEEV